MRYIAAGLDFADPAFGDPRLFLLRLGDLFAGSGGTVLIDEARWHRRSGSMLAQSFSAEAIKYWHSTGGAESQYYFSASSCISIGLHPEHHVTPFVSMLSTEAPSTARPAPAMTSSSRCAQRPDRLIAGPEATPQKADQESTASGKNRIPLSSIRIRTCSGIRARFTMSTSNGDDCTISMAR